MSSAGFGQGDPDAALRTGLGPQGERQTQGLILYAPLEAGRQTILGSFAQPLIGSDETREQRTGVQP
jgi:hypothetical protein